MKFGLLLPPGTRTPAAAHAAETSVASTIERFGRDIIPRFG